MRPANAGTPWCAKQDAQLLELAGAGNTVAQVAELMGRTPEGIVARADRLSYRLTSTDQYSLLSAFIQSARHRSPAATGLPPQGHGHLERAELRTPGLQACATNGLPLLLEVHTEHFYLVLHALEVAGFDVKSRPNKPARYVVNDSVNAAESV